MNKKNICVIGGGIAGIAVATKLLKLGYSVSLYEKNSYLGGLCSGYQKDGYHIDACFHWLMGTRKDTKIFKMWEEVGGLSKDTPIYHSDTFLTISNKNETVHLYVDLDESEKEWISLSKEDEDAITKFFNTVRSLKTLWEYSQSSKRSTKELLKSFKHIRLLAKGSQYSRESYSLQFKNETIRLAIKYGLTGYNNALFFMVAYAAFSSGDSGVPLGGAEEFIKRIHDHLVKLGCDIHLNEEVDEIIIQNKKAVGIRIKDKTYEFDRVVSCLDPNYTLKHLLKNKYKVNYYDELNRSIHKNSISSCVLLYLSAPKKELEKIDVPTLIDIHSMKVGEKEFEAMLVRPYHFDPYFDNKNESVVSVFFDQNEVDFKKYQKMSDEEYRLELSKVSKIAQKALENKYPFLKGKTKVIVKFGPKELNNSTYTSFGAIQSYSYTDKSSFTFFSGKLYKVSNLYFASQWNRKIGGTPSALISGLKIAKRVHRSFLISNIIKRKR